LAEHEHALAGSQFGKYFAKRVNLPLWKRRPDKWRHLQDPPECSQSAGAVSGQDAQPLKQHCEAAGSESSSKPRKRKHEVKVGDEIDALFQESLGREAKRAALDPVKVPGTASHNGSGKDDLDIIFSAIRAAPKEERQRKKG
jgi:nucleolar protein 9